jgi:hypothetical protein
MCLAGAFETGQTGILACAVVARVTRPGLPVDTVVLDLGDGAGMDPGASMDPEARRDLCSLQDTLLRMGTTLRLVITSSAARRALMAGAAYRFSPEVLHPSLRAAVLAAYAELPGPGLVDARIRAALAVPAETVGDVPAGTAGPRRPDRGPSLDG